MDDHADVSAVYQHDIQEGVVRREGYRCPDKTFDPPECHATLVDVREVVEEYERSEGRVHHLLLGAKEYEEIVAYLVYQRGFNDPIQMGNPVGDSPEDVHELVEDTVGADVIVTPEPQVEPVGNPVSVLFQSLAVTSTEGHDGE